MPRKFFGVLAVAALGAALWPADPACAGEAPAPGCVRVRIGSGGACVTLGWYVGLWRAIDDRAVDVGLRLTIGGSPATPTPSAQEFPPGMAPLEPPVPRAGTGHPGSAVVAAVSAYGLLPLAGGLERFIAGEPEPGRGIPPP